MARYLSPSEFSIASAAEWTLTNCTLTPLDGVTWPPPMTGKTTKVTATAGGDVVLTLARFIPAIAAQNYRSGCWWFNAGTARNMLSGINWYDASFTPLTPSTGTQLAVPTPNIWTPVDSAPFAAPVGAVWAKPFYTVKAATAAQVFWAGGCAFAKIENPFRLHNAPSSAWMSRKARTSLLQSSGVRDVAELKVVQRKAGPNLSVDITAGSAYVPGSDVMMQGAYYCENDASENLLLTPADLVLPRYTSLFAKVVDSQFSTDPGPPPTNSWGVVAVDGTPNASPVAPATPKSSLRLADVLVPAKAQVILQANIIDKRIFFQTQGPQIYTLDGSSMLIQGGTGPWVRCNSKGIFFLPYPNAFPNRVLTVIVNDAGGNQPADPGWAAWAHGTMRVWTTTSQNRAGTWGFMRFGNAPYAGGWALLRWTAIGV